MNKTFLTGLCAGACLLALATPASALGPGVTLRVEGKTANLVPATAVSLDPLGGGKPDGEHQCAPYSFGAALGRALGANEWSATYNASLGSYYLTRVKDFTPTGNDYFALWLNHKYSTLSVCDAASLQGGDEMLILVDYCDYDPAVQSCKNDSVLPLALDVPKTVTVGVPFTATVTRYAQDGSIAPVAGASVGGATTDSAGHAAVTIMSAGPASLRASKPNFAGIDAATCATTGSDGLCGTTKPCVHDGDDGACGTADRKPPRGRITSIKEQQSFAKGKGPRTLAGTVDPDVSGLREVALRLTRTDGKKCWTFDGSRERLVRMKRCGAARGRFFSAGDRGDWSYLLPSQLPRGRYVLDVQVTDNAGNVDRTLQRTRNRIVFRVR
jgi:hypothetical protein